MSKKMHTEISGGIAADVLIGSARADHIQGHGGDDRLSDLDGRDLIRGGVGDDWLFGGDGNDRLYGGVGDDRLFGGGGNDKLHGGRGDDRLTGGDGNDRFVFDLHGGNDIVTDYAVGEDRLDLRDFNFANTNVALAHAAQSDADVIFTFDTGDTVTLHNVQLSTLSAADIVI